MKYAELVVLLPCHSLEDFPVYQEGAEAEGLLAAWSCLWHPALLAAAERLPTWYRADGPPSELANRLLVIPPASETLLLAGWASRAQNEGACVVRKLRGRNELVAAALAELDGGDGRVESELAADFLALGLCYLLVELLTRQMRYMSNVDETHLRNEAVAAAQAATAGQAETARQRLQNCFDVLAEARERFYPVEAYLVDLVLMADTTLGASLRAELTDSAPKSLLLSGHLLEKLARTEPRSLAALRRGLEQGTVSLVGGEYAERELPLLPVESVLAEFRRGAAVYRQHLGAAPTVYGRRRFGLSPVLPQVLSRLGFQGAVHVTLDEGQFPRSGQSKTRWEGLDTTAIDALCRLPLDAMRPESFLGFPRKMGEAMDLDHVATVVLAHWAGQASPFLGDLRRMARYAPVLGKFITLNDYFSHTDRPSELTRFRADQYRAPYLRDAVVRRQVDPLSRLSRHHRRQALGAGEQAIATLAELVSGEPPASRRALSCEVERADGTACPELDARLAEQLSSSAVSLAQALRSPDGSDRPGYLVINPLSFSRRAVVEVPELAALPDRQGAVLAVEETQGTKRVSIEMPPLGFVWIGAGSPPEATEPKAAKQVESEPTIRNEFLEVAVSSATGGILAIRDYAQRGNRLSQQLAYRKPGPRPKPGDLWRDPDELAEYSTMSADSVEVTSPGPALSEIVSRGNLLDAGQQRLAGFTQRVQLPYGSRVVRLEIECDVSEEPRADAWSSYYAARFAWPDEEAELRRSVSLTAQPTGAKRIEAPHYVEIRAEKSRTAILTGGLAYHRRIGPRMLDTLLVVRGESQRRFSLGLGFGLAQPAQAALDLLVPPAVVRGAPPTAAPSGWLFHIDAKNVVATHWEPLGEEQRLVGFRVRLLETAGLAGRVRLRAFRALGSARQVDFQGQPLADLAIEDDRLSLEISAFEWVEVEGRWR